MMRVLSLSVLFICLSAAALAQTSGLRRTILLNETISVPGRELIMAKVEIAPGAVAARHTHPGEETAYVLEGDMELLIDGEPPRRMQAGDSVLIPAGKVHAARTSGAQTGRLLSHYLVEKGKPLATPAP